MKPNNQFLKQPKSFWANVRTLSEAIGYTDKSSHQVKIPSPSVMATAMQRLGLESASIVNTDGTTTELGQLLFSYFGYRAQVLNTFVEPHLMNVQQAKKTFLQLRKQLNPQCPIPMNKQSGTKKTPAFLTGIINMLIEANAGEHSCDYNPMRLTTVTQSGIPLRTLARRVDGAFPSAVNPIAVWEIKEYYYTTSFGSRVADGVYETLLDGMEIEELREHEQIDVKHYLMIDAHYTWWECGRSYLCRILDMLHMGYVDEVLFGAEVIERIPILVKEWVEITKTRRTLA